MISQGTREQKILLMGLRRGGKSSIRQVIFHGMQPIETLYLESTTKPTSEKLSSLANFVIEEIPGQVDVTNPEFESSKVFKGASTVIYVIDSQDEYLLSLQNVVQVISQGYKIDRNIHFEILIHKVDGLSEDFRLDTKRDIIQRINDDLVDIGAYDADVTFHMTSIFDQSIVEALSRIIQKLVPELSSLTQLLDMFCMRTGVEKAFVFEASSKIYLATDSSPVDAEIYQVCSDFIDVSADLGGLYGTSANTGNSDGREFSTSRFNNGSVICLTRLIKGCLLVCLCTSETDNKITLVEFNADVFREGMEKIYA
ncbi:Gtr2 protein [Starmerella bacillaris]|uniref:GTP-binding protein n=1 Tax=Starmerella bacillaris TaxID=1247836 RepID=A0AAV5RMQ6_STABA|nr:Gtr2 protein [Starmerella bacillaris]